MSSSNEAHAEDTTSDKVMAKKIACVMESMEDTERLFEEIFGSDPKHRKFHNGNVHKIEELCTQIKYRLSKKMPGGNAFISPRETWNMRNEGANCVAQTIFLASMMGCLRGAKKGKPPCTYLVAFKSQVKGTCGHSVLAVLINKDLHERDAKKAGRNVEGIHYLDPPESMGGTSSHVGNSKLQILDAVAKDPEAGRNIPKMTSDTATYKTIMTKLWGAGIDYPPGC